MCSRAATREVQAMSRSPTIAEILGLCPVVPVVTLDDEGIAHPLAAALLRGGIGIVEVTLRTASALKAIENIVRAVPQMRVGAGTVRSAADLRAAADAGASFAVSPGATARLLAAGSRSPIPYLPAIATASELMTALEAGYQYFKFFPASVAGGIELLRALEKPFPEAGFCPTGGISERTARAYLELTNVVCVGGSWITPAKALASGDWAHVESLARSAAALAPERGPRLASE
jgi:2-dehydro-3-deoxyphosphogluconate aldolase / (4S)-4-hydroxy-2-oxoglutarate aldolase